MPLVNARQCLWSLGFNTWVNYILYGRRPKSRHRICQIDLGQIPSYCPRRGMDSLGFSRTLSRTVAMFPIDLAFRGHTGIVWSTTTDLVVSNLVIGRRIWTPQDGRGGHKLDASTESLADTVLILTVIFNNIHAFSGLTAFNG